MPNSPGGGYDVYSRMLEPYVEAATGAQIVVENRPAGGGLIAYQALATADPDGRTLGILNGPNLLMQGLLEEGDPLHPLEDFTPLARVADVSTALFVRGDSPILTISQLLDLDGNSPLVFGVLAVGSSSWVWAVVAQEILGLRVKTMVGYPGTREASMALIRGDHDYGGYTYDSMRDRVRAGALRPLLLLGGELPEDAAFLEGVPLLTGDDGVAARRARELGLDSDLATSRATALRSLYETGRLIAAPPGMDPGLTACLRSALAEVLRNEAFVASATQAGRDVSYAHPDELVADLETTRADRDVLGIMFRNYVNSGTDGR